MFKHLLMTAVLLLPSSAMALRADINNDGRVDFYDLAILAEEWLMTDTYGPELITNGGFDDTSVWINDGWTIVGGQLVGLIYIQAGDTIYQSIDIVAGWTYRIAFTDASSASGYYTGSLGGTSFNYTHGQANVIEVTAGSDNNALSFIAVEPGATIDNVSVQLVIPEGALVTEQTAGRVTVKFAVPLGHAPGDYAMLYSNNGSGSIDWDTPVSTKQIPLFPNGAGNYGFGTSPFGYGPFGLPYGKNLARGFGYTPFGYSPFGFGSVLITERIDVTDCGDWLFGVKCFDALGNEHTGTPNEVAATVHVAPPRPAGLQKESYDPDTDILTLSVIDPTVEFPLGSPPSRLWPALTGGPYEVDPPSQISPPSGDTDDGAVDPGLPARV